MLLSFGVHPNIPYRRAADYVDRILRGAKAADLPVEEISRFELVINLAMLKPAGRTSAALESSQCEDCSMAGNFQLPSEFRLLARAKGCDLANVLA